MWLFVVMVTTDCEELVPFRETCAGETLQVVFVGAPLHDRATDPVNPPAGVMVTVDVPEELRPIVFEAGNKEIEKSLTP